MGNFLFIVVHLVALFFLLPALLFTVPLHIIYAVMSSRSLTSPSTHVTCPDCKELVHKEAKKCRHCGAGLVPESVQFEMQRAARRAAGKRWWQT